MMRAAVMSAIVLASATTLFAQEYLEYKSMQDRFSIVFPAQPKVTEVPYTSEFKSILPSRVYTVDQGQTHFKVTVVDYNNIQAVATQKAKSCPPGAETCLGTPTDGSRPPARTAASRSPSRFAAGRPTTSRSSSTSSSPPRGGGTTSSSPEAR